MYFDWCPATKKSATGNANATGNEVASAIPPIKVGPAKYAAIAIKIISINKLSNKLDSK